MTAWRIAVVLAFALACSPLAHAGGEKQALPIIPGAAGFGMETPAGSGRDLPVPKTRVIKVTNLNDRGPGSLREDISAKGPPVVLFEVSGYITLKYPFLIKTPYLIPGQARKGGVE